MPTTIVLTGGGSGGHITPLLSLAHAVKKKKPDYQIAYIGFKGEAVAGLKSKYGVFDQSYFINAGKFRRYHGESWLSRLLDIKTWLLNIRDFFRVIAGTASAYKLLGEIKPQLVFSKGGFVAVPVGIAARLRGIGIVTHDSDTSAGLANKIIGRWALANAVGAENGAYPYPKGRTVFTGIPVDERIKPVEPALQKKYKTELGIPSGDKVLLVAGGGLGARDLNRAVASIAANLLDGRSDWHILHLSGTGQLEDTTAAYSELAPEAANVKVIGFSDEFYQLVGAADLIVSRAGATALAEFSSSKKACVLVPAGHLAGGHQLHNARKLEESGSAVSVSLEKGTAELRQVLEKLMSNPQERAVLAENFHRLALPAAADELAALVVGLAEKEMATA